MIFSRIANVYKRQQPESLGSDNALAEIKQGLDISIRASSNGAWGRGVLFIRLFVEKTECLLKNL